MNQTTKDKIRAEQIDKLESIQKNGYNIVTCGSCGMVFIHDIDEDVVTCPHCFLSQDNCDCPDLFYREMQYKDRLNNAPRGKAGSQDKPTE